jgi:formylmethanofuran dehydrogenase subunit E
MLEFRKYSDYAKNCQKKRAYTDEHLRNQILFRGGVSKMTFDDVVDFHGHACPGLAIGFRVASFALRELGDRAADEELVAIVENNSCAVDAVQVMTGCTFGKGNFIYRDYGKQVYTFIRRPTGEALRIAVGWETPATEKESPEETAMWQRYADGDRSKEVMQVVHARKTRKMQMILAAADSDLFHVTHPAVALPAAARIYPSLTCEVCGEKVMEPRTRTVGGKTVCIPCAEMSDVTKS